MSTLEQSELIDDRALEAVGDDRFRHSDLAVELADLVTTVRTPANIALFAPWGSGKTGMANLVREQLERKPGWGRNLRFARFDAFKYAEFPLRRNFIAEMARALDVDDDAFTSGLYRSTTRSTLRFDKHELGRLVRAFLTSLALVVAMTIVILVIVALVSKGSTSRHLSELLGRYLVSAVPLSALITGFVALATKGLTVNASRAAPSTEEEFESRFCDLLARVKADRIVIFVDELDRCAPDEVASTLETIKTFLEVERCVFIVAADHQVLEQALRKRVRQETPHDVTNPYYSAGSSYLDKVFQFQMSLPPLKPRRLSSFAVELVRGRPGVWSRIERVDDVVTVLLPTHVTSPRRVKVLLNSFALTYRLAERRAADGVLAANVPERAAEIARLVCLRCEFPLFASDLEQDVRILDALSRFAEAGRDAEGVEEGELDVDDGGLPDDLIRRARAYYWGHRPVAELLVRDDGGDDNGEPEATSETSVRAVQHAHTQQLVRYILKTAHVPGPHADLVHFESSGAGLSIDPVDAQNLETAAVDNDVRTVERLIGRLDVDKRSDALRLLAGEVAEALPGLEGDNVTSILLRAVAAFPGSLESIADELAAAVVRHERAAGLRSDSYAGALLLADAHGHELGDRLRDQVLRQPDALESSDVALALLGQAQRLPATQRDALGASTTWLLLHDVEALVNRISEDMPPLATALDAAEEAVRDEVGKHYSALEERKARAASAAAPAGVVGAEPAATAEPDDDDDDDLLKVDPAIGAQALINAFVGHGRRSDAQALAALFLRCSQRPLRTALQATLEELGPVEDDRVRVAILNATTWADLGDWPRWLGVLPDRPGLAEGEREVGEELTGELWTNATADHPADTESVRAVAVELARVAGGRRTDLLTHLRRTSGTGVASDAAAGKQAREFALAWHFVECGFLGPDEVADLVVEASADTLRHAKDPTEANEEVRAHVVTALRPSLRLASAGRVADLVDALEENPWLSDAQDAALELEGMVRAAEIGGDPPPLDVVRKHAHNWEEDVADGLAYWLDVAEPEPSAAWAVLSNLSHTPPAAALRDALRRYSERRTSVERYELLSPALKEPFDNHDLEFLQAAGLADLEPRRAAPLLTSAAERASNDGQRRVVLRLWQMLGPTGNSVRRHLIETIWLPLAEGGPTRLRAALDYFPLVVPAPKGMQRALVKRLRALKIDSKELAKLLDRRLLDAGWIKKGWFASRSETVESD